MRFRLRTLMMLLAVLPPMGGVIAWLYRELDDTAAATLTFWLIVGIGLLCWRYGRATVRPT